MLGLLMRNWLRNFLAVHPNVSDKAAEFTRRMPWLEELIPLCCSMDETNSIRVHVDDADLFSEVGAFESIAYRPRLYFVSAQGRVLGEGCTPVLEKSRLGTGVRRLGSRLDSMRYIVFVRRWAWGIDMIIYTFPKSVRPSKYLNDLIIEKSRAVEVQADTDHQRRQKELEAARREAAELVAQE